MDKIIKNILTKLNNNGYEAYIVGGYVRDYILGLTSHDVDICTNALPKDIIKIFNIKQPNPLYGSINIKTKKYNIDITTYRKESNYILHSPKKITYINNIKEDLLRRDFTINSILMDKSNKIIDYYGGLEDIKNKTIRCIGNTQDKLTEDPLRILRAIRFKIIYNYNLTDDIINFIKDNNSIINTISYYRRKQELDKILLNKNKIEGLKLIENLNIKKYLEIDYNNIKYTTDIFGMYSQITFSDKYDFTKNEKDIINKIKIVTRSGINNETLYYYGLYINQVAGEILQIDKKVINNMYNKLPIKTKKDVKISIESIVKLNNNCYNNINLLYKEIETNILNNKLKNNKKDIIKFLRK